MAEHFTIIHQRQTVVPMGAARFEDVVEITFRTTPSGIERKIDVPLDRYNAYSPSQLHDLIEPLALDAERKHNL